MSIIQPSDSSATHALEVKNYVNQVKSSMLSDYLTMSQVLQNQFALVYQPPMGISVQEVFDEFQSQNPGDAAHLFAVAGKFVELMTITDTSYVPPTVHVKYTINSDGSVTIN